MRVCHRILALFTLAGTIGAPALLAQNESGSVKAILQGGPDVGQRAPDFSLAWANRDGVGPVESPYQLASDRGKTVVVAFYPRDFTKGCTAEMRTFAEQYDSLFGPNVVVVGISPDSVATHSRFATSLGLPFRLLSDPQQRVSKQYASRDSEGANRRAVYVVGPDGRVKFRNMSFNAMAPRDYAELRAAVRSSSRGS
jgi:thioredoxin-dependent peroxiredoxin